MTGLNEVLAVYLMAAKEVSQRVAASKEEESNTPPHCIHSGSSCVSPRWRGGPLQHGASPPGLGLHQPVRHHRGEGGGVGGPPPPTLRGAAQGGEGEVRHTRQPRLQH